MKPDRKDGSETRDTKDRMNGQAAIVRDCDVIMPKEIEMEEMERVTREN